MRGWGERNRTTATYENGIDLPSLPLRTEGTLLCRQKLSRSSARRSSSRVRRFPRTPSEPANKWLYLQFANSPQTSLSPPSAWVAYYTSSSSTISGLASRTSNAEWVFHSPVWPHPLLPPGTENLSFVFRYFLCPRWSRPPRCSSCH